MTTHVLVNSDIDIIFTTQQPKLPLCDLRFHFVSHEMQALVSVKSSEERALASIPVEILRIIFEKAMEDEPLPVHLALVSWQVKGW